MEHLFDFALLVISGCSAIYCWTLSQRLRALQNLKKGVGHAMVNLTKSVTAVEANAVKLNREAQAAIAELRAVLAQVDECENKVDILLETMDRQSRETWKDYRDQANELTKEVDGLYTNLHTLVKDAKSMTSMMNDQLINVAEKSEGLEKERKEVATLLEKARQASRQTLAAKTEKSEKVRKASEVIQRYASKDAEVARALAQRLAKVRQATPDEAKKAGFEDVATLSAKPGSVARDAVRAFEARAQKTKDEKRGTDNPFAERALRQAGS